MTRKELYRRVPYTYLTNPGSRTFVYVIKCGEFIKIGIAKDVQRRLDEISLCNPYRATVAAVGDVASCLALKAEADLHRHFANARHRREWFRLSPKDVRQTFVATINLAREVEDAFKSCLDAYHSTREKRVKLRIARTKKAQEDQDHAHS